jgi:DNA-binding HxlR family transcriptional regulator
MKRRPPKPFDPLAAALEQVGDRWTLIIVRALMNGPQRYSDLRTYVVGSGSNLLADRLRRLADLGIVIRNAGSRAGSNVTYQLTDRGWALAPIIEDLVKFGLRSLIGGPFDGAAPFDREVFDRGSAMTAPNVAVNETYEWTIDDVVFTLEVIVDGLQIVRTPGPAKRPAVKLRTTAETFEQVLAQKSSLGEAVRSNELTVSGRPAAIERMFFAIGFPPDQIKTLKDAAAG